MSFALSRAMSAATAGYAAYALADPAHLARALGVSGADTRGFGALARSYGVRDAAVSAAGILGPPAVVQGAMVLRVLLDLGDSGVLALATDDARARRRVIAVTTGWAALNTLALVIDRRRD